MCDRFPIITLAALLAVACGDETHETFPDFELSATQRLVVVGDNVASNPTRATSFLALLIDNDDALFPAFAERDLATFLGDPALTRLDRGGDSYSGLSENLASLCRCTGSECDDTCLDTESTLRTVLLVELGANDLFGTFLRLLNDSDLRADPQPALDEMQVAIQRVLGIATDRAFFRRPPKLVVTNVYDPSDGEGDLADIAAAVFPVPSSASEITPALSLQIIGGFNDIIARESEARSAVVVDVHTPFLGHGLHNADANNPHHDAQDPTPWLRGFIDPNLRGAHEIRRALWESFTREHVTAIPMGLPPSGTLGLPMVSTRGWSNALVDSQVADVTPSPTLGDIPNLANDPGLALGEPEGSTAGTVALGALGTYVVVDLGAGEAATDAMGDDIVVIEFGPLSGGTPEPYRVSVSNTPGGPFTHLGDATGERGFDLSEIGVSVARYVKVESLVQPADLQWLGSPFYPGPEIDAIGAVTPEPP